MALIQTLTKFPGANPLPLIQSFVTSFDWGEVSKVLPVANNQPLSMGEFQGDQQNRLNNPEVGGVAAGNLQNMGRVVNNLPQAPQEMGNAS